MPNPIISLNNPATAVVQLQALFFNPPKAFFLIIGNSQEAAALANAALPYAQNWRYIVYSTLPLLPVLRQLPVDPAILPLPVDTQWCSLGIAANGTIVQVNQQYDLNDVIITLMAAESY